MKQLSTLLLTFSCCALTPCTLWGQIYGCTSPFAPNYNPEATIEDNTCDYDVPQLLADGFCIQELLDGNVQISDIKGAHYPLAGGIIGHIDTNDDMAIIWYSTVWYAAEEIGDGEWEPWGCLGVSTGVVNNEMFNGLANTVAIVNYECFSSNPEAALKAIGFEGFGYNDWALPTMTDYEISYSVYNLNAIEFGWSSVEAYDQRAYLLGGSDVSKSELHRVFGVRYISLSSCGCIEETACNYLIDADVNTGACLFEDAIGECGGNCEIDIDEDGICDDEDDCIGEYDECGICNGPGIDECGVCDGPGAIYECGCADIPEGECDCEGTIPVTGYDCDGNCLNDADGDGVCDEFEVLGCTDITACNYEDDATEENGSCILQGDFCNDGDFLTIDDFVQADCSCNGFGCNNPSACNYSETALHQPELCDFESCQGCLDDTACNYSSNSTIDDGSCYYVGDACDDGDEASFNDSVQSDCSCEGDYIGGCTYWIACNYDPDAVIDDGSCTFIGEPCDDLNPLTFNDIVDENCFCGDIAITNVGEWTFSGFKVYPNPSNGMVWVEAGGAGSRFDVNVYDSASRIVASKTGIERLNLDVSNCAPGLYLIEVNVDGSVQRTQLIIQ